MQPRWIDGPSEILSLRLQNQYLVRRSVDDPREMVAWLGAVQSQDYPGALWGLALRLRGASLQSLQCAFERGEIVRTHVLRPTWHFVAPEDIRWMLALTGQRVRRSMASRERDLGMDATLVSHSIDAITRALEGGRALTRPELGVALNEAGIDWRGDGGLLAHLASTAELAGIVCSGPLKGAQHTYALLDERVPPAAVPGRDEAVVELVQRYFASHGPATLNDFAWWSGLTVGDARQGLDALGTRFISQIVGDLTYWFDPDAVADSTQPGAMLLLPNYDEFTVAYHSRELLYPRQIANRPEPRYAAPFGNTIVVDGVSHGIWTRSARKGRLAIEPMWFNPPTLEEQAEFGERVAEYLAFMGVDAARTN